MDCENSVEIHYGYVKGPEIDEHNIHKFTMSIPRTKFHCTNSYRYQLEYQIYTNSSVLRDSVDNRSVVKIINTGNRTRPHPNPELLISQIEILDGKKRKVSIPVVVAIPTTIIVWRKEHRLTSLTYQNALGKIINIDN